MAIANVGQVDALFISPHFDDVALSCGGTVALEARGGRALVVTVFAGYPTEPLNSFAEFQHRRWGRLDDAVDERRREDAAAMETLGVEYRWLDFQDAIYRGALYLSDDDLFGSVKPEDLPVVRAVADAVEAVVATARPRRVYLPLAVGNHVDHQICYRLEARMAANGLSVFFYEDFPYAATVGAVTARIARIGRSMSSTQAGIGDTIERRLRAIGCYASQLATIFRHYGDAEEVVRRCAADVGGGQYAERFWVIGSARRAGSRGS